MQMSNMCERACSLYYIFAVHSNLRKTAVSSRSNIVALEYCRMNLHVMIEYLECRKLACTFLSLCKIRHAVSYAGANICLSSPAKWIV